MVLSQDIHSCFASKHAFLYMFRLSKHKMLYLSCHSRIPQTSILTNLDLLPAPPLAIRHRWTRNNKLTHRFALAHFLVSVAHHADLNTAHRSAEVAVALAFFAAVVEDVSLCDCAEDRARCEGVDDAGAGEDAKVGEGAGA